MRNYAAPYCLGALVTGPVDVCGFAGHVGGATMEVDYISLSRHQELPSHSNLPASFEGKNTWDPGREPSDA